MIMTQKEIIAGNKLIAEFMGGKVIDNIFICNESTKTHNERYLHQYNIAQARYNTSWDWLIPCITKAIENNILYSDWTNQLHDGLLTQNIENCYDAIVNFIKWFNEEQKENM